MNVRKKIQSKTKQSFIALINHIWFPQNNRWTFLFDFVIMFSSVLLLFWLGTFFSSQANTNTMFFVISLFCIALVSFLGNGKAGIMTTGIVVFVLGYVYVYPTTFSSESLMETVTFLLTGIGISLLIHVSKRVDVQTEYGVRVNKLQEKIENLTNEKLKVEREIQARDEFISVASHELKTPLTTTLLKLQTALHNVRNTSLANFSVQKFMDMLESAEQQSKRISRMISNLLNVSLIKTGRLEIETEDADLITIIRDVVRRFDELAENEHTDIRFHATGELKGKFDVVRLEQVFSNLISNALKYGGNKPIEITVKKSGSQAQVSIKDHGIGVSKDQRDKIFNLFGRAVQDKEYKGLGIGLYISHQIIRAHQGAITVNSKPGVGSEFIIHLPLK